MDNFNEVLPKLVQIQLFSDFNINDENDKRILKEVYESMTIETYQKGDVIIAEGKFGDMFYILYEGSIHICRKTPAGDTIALADLKSEDNVFFGETALISDDPRTATVKAITDCKCIALSSTKFLDVCDKEPLLGYRVLLKLAKRMAKTIRDTNTDKATLYEALYSEIESGVFF
ncbi:MAG: cyclic nucleotide-binding domain-containing protein [Treponema sp.]|nr:cyclic nucleotide-binding domain-containing protein [Treponema sp.]